MIRTVLLACQEFINRKIFDEKLAEKLKDTKVIYRDELGNENIISPLKRRTVNKSVRFADSEHESAKDEKEELMKESRSYNIEELLGERERMNGTTRVKVKMTKEEAAKLLSKFKCNEGGFLQFKDVVPVLVALPMDRVTVMST
ncbi:hypothetical protein P8452_40658 [Trifolium repens]|jgi:hypothetical protein|nr:hypothetical protein P8452_40658 [Trifolium repens]